MANCSSTMVKASQRTVAPTATFTASSREIQTCMRFSPRHYLFIVMLGLDPSIQGDRSVVCPWTLGSSPRVTNGVVETASPQLHCHHPTVMLGLDPSIQGNRSIARPWPLGSSPRVTKKEPRVTRREAVRVRSEESRVGKKGVRTGKIWG